jgi:hypothetical protein
MLHLADHTEYLLTPPFQVDTVDRLLHAIGMAAVYHAVLILLGEPSKNCLH